jgi:uridine kinase
VHGAEGCIEDLGALPALLARRARWIEAALEKLGVAGRPATPPAVLGVTGPGAVGKSLFARDAARILADRGASVAVVGLDDFRRPGREANGDPLGELFDVDALRHEVLEVHARTEPVDLRRRGCDRTGIEHESRVRVPAGALLILEGPLLLDPRLRPSLARAIHLEAPDEVLLARVAGREGRHFGPEPLARFRGGELPALRAAQERHPPAVHADLTLDASNPLGPGA